MFKEKSPLILGSLPNSKDGESLRAWEPARVGNSRRQSSGDGLAGFLLKGKVFTMTMTIISTDCTDEQKKEDMPELLVLHKRAMETEMMWQFFGGVITLNNGNKYQVAEFE